MKINMPSRHRWVLRFIAISVPIYLAIGMALEVAAKRLFPPHQVDWQALERELIISALGSALLAGLSALLPLVSGQKS